MKTLTLAILVIFMALPTLAAAEVPGILPVQGVLTDADGNPLTEATTITFTIYGATGDAAATVHAETLTVDVDRGFFSVALGGGSTPLDLDIFKDGARELGIKVNTDAEMTPRLKLGTTPFAAHARTADDSSTLEGNAAADFVGTAAVDSVSTGMIQDGAVTPAKLASPQSLYRVTNVFCENQVGTLMTTDKCRASQHNVDSCSNICQVGQFRRRDCSNNCTCVLPRLCLIGQPCDFRGSNPQCNNSLVGAAAGN